MAMTQEEIRGRVWAYIVENFLYMRQNVEVDPDASLLRKGVLDSMGVLEMIGFVEESFGISVDQDEVTMEHFGTLNAITRYIESKLAGTGSVAG